MNRGTPPAFAGLLLRILPLGDRRAEVEADLLELFALRARHHSERYARRRYYGDVVSLWRRSGMRNHHSSPRPVRASVLREIGRDLTYAARLLRRSPSVVAITIAGLGLAIGVSTSVFSLLNGAVFRPSGIEDPDTAVHVLRSYKSGTSTAWRYSEYLQLRSMQTGVTLEAWLPQRQSFPIAADSDSPQTASVMFVSGGYLAALSGRVTLGRLLSPADDRVGALPVVVVSHGFWARRLGEDPAIVGRAFRWNGVEVTVVGVSDRKFRGPSDAPPDFWAPIAIYHAVSGGPPFHASTSASTAVIGRVHPGITQAQAEARLGAGAGGIASERDEFGSPRASARLQPAGGQGLNRDPKGAGTMALVVAMAVIVIGLVLVLACVNVANLLLASALSRQREIGVRLALGASRGRLARQLLTESLSLGLAGGALGLMLTIMLVPLLAVFASVPASLDVTPDIRVYGFLVAVSIVAGLGAGLTPARHASRGDLVSPLKGTVAGGEVSARPARLRSTLVAVQAAASIVLVVLAALLTRGMVRAAQIDVGFDAHRLLTTSSLLQIGTYDAAGAKAYWDLALERVRAVPGVKSAALAQFAPFGDFRRGFNAGGYKILQNDTRADYFATIGLRAVRGRTYTAEEVAGRAQVAVISESLAHGFFPGEDPIGQSLDRIVRDSHHIIIGVASNAITDRLREASSAMIYQPLENERAARMLIRADGHPDALIPSVRNALYEIDPRGVRLDIKPVSEGLQQQLNEPRILASLASALAVLALALAVVGLYGVTAFVVGQRSQEISVRMALGASGRDIIRLLLGDSLRPVMFGLAGGVFVALMGSRVFAGLLYGVGSADPLAFSVAVLVLLTAAVAAVIVPTLRATAVDPAALLRQL